MTGDQDDRGHTGGETPADAVRAVLPGYQGMELAVIHRYVTGICVAAERRLVDAWAAAAPERRSYLNALGALHAHAPSAGRIARERAWERIAPQLERPRVESGDPFRAPWDGPATHIELRRPRPPRVLAGAFAPRVRSWALPVAVAAMLTMAAVGVRLAAPPAAAQGPANAATMRRITTTRGQRAEISLDDGTRVVLGVDSRLEFPSDFGTGQRDVYLDGTAYFHVVHDPQHPFVVHTTNAVTRDVGTQFVVRAYPGDRRTEVVVAEGSVDVEASQATSGTAKVLTRDERGVLVSGSTTVAVSAVDPAEYTAWMTGELVFHDTPLTEVVRELRRWYETDVEIGDATLAQVPFSASFAVESFGEALATMTTVLPVRAVRQGKKVLLVKR